MDIQSTGSHEQPLVLSPAAQQEVDAAKSQARKDVGDLRDTDRLESMTKAIADFRPAYHQLTTTLSRQVNYCRLFSAAKASGARAVAARQGLDESKIPPDFEADIEHANRVLSYDSPLAFRQDHGAKP